MLLNLSFLHISKRFCKYKTKKPNLTPLVKITLKSWYSQNFPLERVQNVHMV